MTNKVITNIDQVSPAWLTEVLTNNGAVTHGEVESIEYGSGQGNWSTSANIYVNYSVDAKGLLPRRLFLKMVHTDLGDGEWFGDSEVTYYLHDYVDLPEAPLLRCYDGAYSETLHRYHLLLEDVSFTHIEACQKKPTLSYGLALAEGLAVLHAHWWGEARLAKAGAPVHDARHIRNFIDIAQPGAEHIIRHFSSELKPHWTDTIHNLFAHHPQAMIHRSRNPNGFTLIHGDAGCYNILAPRLGDRPIYLIDRQPFNWSMTTWLGVYDLAYAMVLDWEPEIRRQFEVSVLKQYHKLLFQNGVKNYAWKQLFDDYRLCAAMGVYIATEYCRGGINEPYIPVWLPMLQRSLIACDDLDCRSLWY